MLRKIDLMHKLFGKVGGLCKDCCHFVSGEYQSIRNLQKCRIYGMTHSAASDWAQRYRACGLYNIADTPHKNVIDLVQSRTQVTRQYDVDEDQVKMGEMGND